MYKTLILLLLFISSIFGKNFLNRYESEIISIDKDSALIKADPIIEVGSSGVIMHKFDNEHQTISKGAIVIEKDEKFAKIKFFDFDYLKQDALPSYKIEPKSGDKVILNYLYNKALPIVPNLKTFKYVQQKFSDLDWVHPDILTMELIDSGNKSPTKEDFSKVCKTNTFALLLFAIKDKAYFVDCNSFKVIKSVMIEESKERLKPFYSRIDLESVSILNFFTTGEVKNYDKYYTNFLGLKDDR